MRTPSASHIRSIVAAAGVALVIAVAPAVAQQYIHSDERREQIQQMIEEHQRPDAGDGYSLNAYLLLTSTAESFRMALDSRRSLMQFVREPGWYVPFEAIIEKENPTPQRIGDALAFLDDMERSGLFPAVDSFSTTWRAVRLPVFDPKEAADQRKALLSIGPMRWALEARLVHALETGDHEAALSSYRGMLAIDRITGHQLTIMDRVRGVNASLRANRHLREAITARPLSPAVVFPALEILESQLGYLPRTSEILAAERILARDGIEHDPAAYGWTIDPDAEKPVDAAAIHDRIIAAAQQLAAVPVRDRRTDPAAIEAQRRLGELASAPESQAARRFSSSYTRFIEAIDDAALDNAATRFMIGLERHKLRHGAYPETLEQLVPQELASLEGDFPVSYGLIYRRDGDSYTLYSPGYDLTDNGGTPYPGRPDLALRPEGAGFDFLYRPSPAAASANAAGVTPADYARTLQQIVEQQQPQEAAAADVNAWDILEETIDRVNKLKTAERDKGAAPYLFWFDALVSDDPNTTREMREIAAVGIEMYEKLGVFESLGRIATTARAIRPVAVPEDAADWHPILYPKNEVLSEARDLAKAAIARARLQLDAGDPAAAVSSLEMALAVSRITAQQVTMAHRVYATSSWQHAARRLREAVIAGRLDADALRLAAAGLERQADWLPPWQASITAELLWLRTLVDLSYDSSAGPPIELADPAMPSQSESQELARKYMTALSTLMTSIRGRQVDPKAIGAIAQMQGIRSGLPKKSVLATCLIGDSYLTFHDVQVLDTIATRLILAIERFKLRTGAYPESLNDLAGHEIPVHELGSAHELIYRRTPDAYTLYAPGPDGIDNGGTPNPENPHPWPGPGSIGFDLVYR